MRLLLEDVNPSKIVCLTYTNAGANEMHERINHELSNWVIFDDEKIIKKLNDLSINPNEKNIYKARTLFAKILDGENKISIQTIHSFCQNILKSFSIEANVPLNFELIEGNKSLFLLEIARKELFKNAQNDIELQKNIAEIFYRITEDSLAVLFNNLISKKDKLDAETKEVESTTDNVTLDTAQYLNPLTYDEYYKVEKVYTNPSKQLLTSIKNVYFNERVKSDIKKKVREQKNWESELSKQVAQIFLNYKEHIRPLLKKLPFTDIEILNSPNMREVIKTLTTFANQGFLKANSKYGSASSSEMAKALQTKLNFK